MPAVCGVSQHVFPPDRFLLAFTSTNMFCLQFEAGWLSLIDWVKLSSTLTQLTACPASLWLFLTPSPGNAAAAAGSMENTITLAQPFTDLRGNTQRKHAG